MQDYGLASSLEKKETSHSEVKEFEFKKANGEKKKLASLAFRITRRHFLSPIL